MNNIPVFLSSDNNYAPFVATTIASICDNTKSFVDFYILDGGITEENKEKICELKKSFDNFAIEFLRLDVDKYFKGFVETSYISKSMYSRFLIPQLKPQLNRALYSDVDVIVLGDIAEMYNESLDDYLLGAVWEEYAEKSVNDERRQQFNLSSEHKFFSSGNLLIDCKKWRENYILDKLMKLECKFRGSVLHCPDQDILNICFDNNYKILDKKYCYIAQNFFFYENHDNILIRHYNGSIKPWRISPETKTNLMRNLDDFWYYAKMTPFYDELYQKTQDKEEQKKLIRHLQLGSLANKQRKR